MDSGVSQQVQELWYRVALGSAVGSAGGSSEHKERREVFATGSEVILVLAAAQGISMKGWSWFQVEMQPAEGCQSDAKTRAGFVAPDP